MMKACMSITEVRENIDSIDEQIVKLMSERSKFVEQAAKFKIDTEDVKAPKRVEAVIEKVRNIAHENDVNPDIVEEVYRTMISCFIKLELQEHKINK
ncbi:chorismate mutase [Lysinibacillus sphaericus]|uniref:chorismate mutase n=1 Tax=Lysinibacillus sphaericus TaxID=1421 RepID=UPI003F7AADA8